MGKAYPRDESCTSLRSDFRFALEPFAPASKAHPSPHRRPLPEQPIRSHLSSSFPFARPTHPYQTPYGSAAEVAQHDISHELEAQKSKAGRQGISVREA